MSSQMLTQRNDRLNELSQIIIDGVITYKLDHIATVFINDRHYFNVFRRYNSVYNIVVEDNNTDIYLHQDYTVRKSLQSIMCLSDYDTANINTWGATSYKHNGPVPSMSVDIADMRWTEIHSNYQAVSVNFGGLFDDLPALVPLHVADPALVPLHVADPPFTPIAQIYSAPSEPPATPVRPHMTQSIRYVDVKTEVETEAKAKAKAEIEAKAKTEAVNTLLSLNIPAKLQFPMMSESDGPSLSMRFADTKKRKRQSEDHHSCYCYMDDDEEGEDDKNNYTSLRSGTQIPKPFSQ